MDEYEIGRGFSKQKRVKLSWDELPAYIDKHIDAVRKNEPWRISHDADGKESVSFGGWKSSILQTKRLAAQYLGSRDLPTNYLVYKWGENDWRQQAPEHIQGWRTIEQHVKALGHDRDSLPDLAARMLVHCEHAMEYGQRQDIDGLATECMTIGAIGTLWNVYTQTDNGDKVMRHHDETALDRGYESHKAMKEQAIQEVSDTENTYPHWKKREIYKSVAMRFDKSPGTIRNWVSEHKKNHETG